MALRGHFLLVSKHYLTGMTSKYFNGINRFQYPDLTAETLPNGKRTYFTPDGPAPSVTTILSSIPNPGLDAWRARVGEEEADRISKEATTIGSHMHDMLECLIKGETWVEPDGANPDFVTTAKKMFRCIQLFGLKGLTEVFGVEVALYFHNMYAGRTDLIGKFNKKVSVIDYKTSLRHKIDDHLDKYKTQTALYSLAHQWMFPEIRFEQAVLLIGIRPNAEYKVPAKLQTVIIPEAELREYQIKAIGVLHEFYKDDIEQYIPHFDELLLMVDS